MRPARTLALSLALTLLAAAPAGAATTRYAAPNGTGDCSQASPCDLATALGGAKSGDLVIALPGHHALTAAATVPDGVTLRGPGADVDGASGADGITTSAGTIEQIVLDGSGTVGDALHVTGAATVRDTVVRSDLGADAVLVSGAGGATLTNVTAFASGGGAAIRVAFGTLMRPTVASSIVVGPVADASGGVAAPSFDQYTDQGGVDPLFVNPPTDLRLRTGSPAVDAADPNDSATGRSDADGLPRQFGRAVDQGAYELTPPGASAAPVSNVTSTSATVNGSIFPNARKTQYSVLYGTNPAALASQPGATVDAGTSPVPVSQGLTGLTPGTTYYVSLVASSSAGALASQVVTFATSPAPIVLPPRHAATILLLGSNRVRVDSRRRWRVLIQCPKVELYPCQGVLAVRSVRSLRFGPGPKKRLVFGSLRFEVPAGATMRVGPTLTKARARLARGLRSTPVAVSVITQGAALADQRFFARRFTMLGPRR